MLIISGESVRTDETEKHYGAIDGLRAMAAVGIVMMHIRANCDYKISGFFYEKMIPSFTHFTILFMAISAFGMCCGYYERMTGIYADGTPQLSLSEFYKKRFRKILPFFGILVLMDFMISPSIGSLYEAFADLTLLFGFLNADIKAIGVGWFLGLIVVFYLCFPFFCVLLETKKKAWAVFGISLIYNFACTEYFNVGRSNILYSSCFFLAGGLVYLYRDKIEAWAEKPAGRAGVKRLTALGSVVAAVVIYYLVGEKPGEGNTATWLLVSVTMLIYAMITSARTRIYSAGDSGGYWSALENPVTKFLSGISMEIYLSHMMVFRVIERLGLNYILGSGWAQYIVMVVVVLAGAILYAVAVQKGIKILFEKCRKRRCLCGESN